MTCETPDLNKTIAFKINGTIKDSCSVTFGCLSANIRQIQPNITVITIPSLSYTNDIGRWTCSYDGINSNSADFFVYGK